MKITNIIKPFIPISFRLPFLCEFLKISGKLDYDIFVLKDNIQNHIRAIDIGAQIGTYSYELSKFFKNVESFEPITESTNLLKAYTSIKKNIAIYNVGLSSKNEDKPFFIPFIPESDQLNFGLGSVIDPGGVRKVITIPVRCLDDYNFQKVGFVKIDVEGNELEVIYGAMKTINRERPVMLIEIEQRHLKNCKITDVFELILSLGYKGGYFYRNTYYPLEFFSYDQHQKPFLTDIYNKDYINNFWFKPIHQ